MDISSILQELRRERDRIDAAITALQKVTPQSSRGNRTGGKRRRRLTPEGRKRLSDMMKKRWAERRRRNKAA